MELYNLMFEEVNFRARKIKETRSEKKLIYPEIGLSSSKLKNLLLFQERTCKT